MEYDICVQYANLLESILIQSYLCVVVFCLNSSQYNACYGSDKIVTEVIMTLIQIFLSLASRFKNTRNIIKTGVVFPINSVVNSNEM